MDLHRLYIWICFFFCLALTAAGILIFFRESTSRKPITFRLLQYFLILIYAFGFYAMWSDVFFRLLFSPQPKHEILVIISGYLALISIPFLLIGLLMLLLWVFHLSKKLPRPWVIAGCMVAVLLPGTLHLVYHPFDLLQNIRQLYAIVVLSVVSFATALLCVSALHYFQQKTKWKLIILIFLSGAIHIPLVMNLVIHPLAELIFIFLFFLTNTMLGGYFVYNV